MFRGRAFFVDGLLRIDALHHVHLVTHPLSFSLVRKMSLWIVRVLYGRCRSLSLRLNLVLHYFKLLLKHTPQKLHRRTLCQLASGSLNPFKQLGHTLATAPVTILTLGFAQSPIDSALNIQSPKPLPKLRSLAIAHSFR